MHDALYRWLHRTWYAGGTGYWLLLPLSAIYWVLVTLRGYLYRAGLLEQKDVGVPVIIVGNLTAGGTGKTPVAVWLAREMRKRGFAPGVVSRGYGGSRSSSPMRVDAASDPSVVGDEPVLIARRAACPVAVDRDRLKAAAMLVEDGADLVIADDGLQHLKLARAYEICVVDGARWLGNRFVLPAGPLRELASRLHTVDQVLVNGYLPEHVASSSEQNAVPFRLRGEEVHRLNGSLSRPIGSLAGTTVHAVAGIGNPRRFFDLLRSHDIQVVEHALRDHAMIEPGKMSFGDEFIIVMTEKDAVKLGTRVSDRFWYVPVSLDMDPALAGPLLEQIDSRMREEQRTV